MDVCSCDTLFTMIKVLRGSPKFCVGVQRNMGGSSRALFLYALERRIWVGDTFPPAALYSDRSAGHDAQSANANEDCGTQTDLNLLNMGLSTRADGTGLPLRRLPSVDELSCDADAFLNGADPQTVSPARDPNTGLLRLDESSLPTQFDVPIHARSATGPPLHGTHHLHGVSISDQHVVWCDDLAEREFGVVPVTQLGDFVL